jgi:hypothetical protein
MEMVNTDFDQHSIYHSHLFQDTSTKSCVKTVDRIMLLAPNNHIPRFSVQSVVISSKKKK